MFDFPTDENQIIYRHASVDHGFTDNQLTRAVQSGAIERIWPGAYLPKHDHTWSREERHKRTAIAANTLSGGSSALTDESAAAVLGMSLLHARWDKVHVATGLKTGGRIDTRRHIHSGPLDDADVMMVRGVKVTSLECTAASIACSRGFAEALAALDSALRLGADPEVLARKLERHRRGVAQAFRALGYADAGSENAGESWGRAQIIDAGLPVPRLQREFRSAEGEFIGRCDYEWDGQLVGEFDGLRKYERDLRPRERPVDAVVREKVREDALRRLGLMVVRWIWNDLVNHRVVPMVREWLDRLGIVV